MGRERWPKTKWKDTKYRRPHIVPQHPPSRPLEGRGGGGACTDPDPGLSLPIRADGAAGRVSLWRDVLIVT